MKGSPETSAPASASASSAKGSAGGQLSSIRTVAYSSASKFCRVAADTGKISMPVPAILSDGIGHLAALNTPVPMIIIGYYLAKTNLPAALKDKEGWLCIALRLLALPLATLAVLLICGVRGDVLTACMICIATPVATSCTMFAARFDRNAVLSVNLVSLSTLLSVVSIPAMVALTNYLGSVL